MNLKNSAIIEPSKIVSFGHPPMETDNVGKRLDGIVATRIETWTGSGGARKGAIGWRIHMMILEL